LRERRRTARENYDQARADAATWYWECIAEGDLPVQSCESNYTQLLALAVIDYYAELARAAARYAADIWQCSLAYFRCTNCGTIPACETPLH